MSSLWMYTVALAVVGIACVVLYVRIRSLIFSTGSDASTNLDFCKSTDAIVFAQREQFDRAKIDLFGSSQAGFQGEDFEFYKNSFGAVELLLDQNPAKLTALSYYRIYKNANDNIRSLLLEYAYIVDNNQLEYDRRNCTFNLECLHRRIHNLTPQALKSLYFPYHHRRYAFTFTREPLTRFMSAVTEIEYRIQEDIDGRRNMAKLPFQSPLGSQQRILEFIRMIVMSGGSQKLFRENRAIEIAHITPQIGTVLLGTKIEEDDFHVFRLDEFEESWKSIVNATKLPLLESLRKRRTAKEWPYHPSSRDPYNTTLAARSLFSYASLDAYHRFGNNLGDRRQSIPVGYTVDDYPRVAKQYLRVLCRLYLADFVCLNYTLPHDCYGLAEEMQQSFVEYKQTIQPTYQEATVMDTLRAVFPQSFMRRLANFVCLYDDTPECEIHVVHGKTTAEAERHDEL